VVSPRAIAVAVWPVGTLMLVYKILQATENPQGYDTVPLLNAVRALIHGGDIYTSKGAFDFLYPPSALAVSLPLGLVPVDAPRWLFSLRISSASSSHLRSSFESSISR
jgi:hypothetical protein